MTSATASTTERPRLSRRAPTRVGGVWAVLRRELGARLLASGYLWSTIVFVAMAFLSPLLLPGSAEAAGASPMASPRLGGDGISDVLVALSFGLIIVFVTVLWGATMAADVVQEKATRVVEILIATIRPWQLLAGKVAAVTIIGLLQIALVIVAAGVGLHMFAGGVDVSAVPPSVVIAGLSSVAIGVPLLAALMAAMAARVEHQEDLGTATQPVYLLIMAPFAAAVYVGLDAPHGVVMQILSLAPLTNIFAMPARIAAGPVSAFELVLTSGVALTTLAAAVWLAGRIYSGSVLRAGSTVTLRQALSNS